MKKRKSHYTFPVVIEKDEDGYYLGMVPSFRSCYTQAKSLPELYRRLDEVIHLCLEVDEILFKGTVTQNEFVGVHQMQVNR